MTTEEQAEAIVNKYTGMKVIIIDDNCKTVIGKLRIQSAIQCAITEVQAIINSNPHSNPLNTSPVYSTMQYWMDILNHLKQM